MKNRMKKLTMLLTNKKAYERTRSLYRKGVLAASVACFAVVPAFAADPLSAITQLSDFIFVPHHTARHTQMLHIMPLKNRSRMSPDAFVAAVLAKYAPRSPVGTFVKWNSTAIRKEPTRLPI